MSEAGRVSRLLERTRQGDAGAADELLPLIYDELRRLADRFLGSRNRQHTLQPTALVHEAFLRLVGRDESEVFANRLHFYRVAAKAMRNVLMNHAQAKGRLKRGGDRERLTLIDAFSADEEDAIDLLALDEALRELTEQDEDLARIVELRFFSGLTIEETAQLLEVSTPTVERRWRLARAFLRRTMRSGDPDQ